MRIWRCSLASSVAAVWLLTSAQAFPQQGSGITIELEKSFVEKYKDRATTDGEFFPVAVSKIHPAKDDGEIHCAGKLAGITFPCVAEVMNAKAGGAGSPA